MIGLGFHILFSYLNKEVAWPSGYRALDSQSGLPGLNKPHSNCQLGLFLAVPRSAPKPSLQISNWLALSQLGVLFQKFFVSVLNCGPHFRLCSYQKIICVIY